MGDPFHRAQLWNRKQWQKAMPFAYLKETKGQAWSNPFSFTANLWNITELKTHFLCPFWYNNLKGAEQQFSKREKKKKNKNWCLCQLMPTTFLPEAIKRKILVIRIRAAYILSIVRQCTSLTYRSVLNPPTISQTEGKCIIWCKSSEGNTNSPHGEITSSSICICQVWLVTELWPQNNILISAYMLPLPKERADNTLPQN